MNRGAAQFPGHLTIDNLFPWGWRWTSTTIPAMVGSQLLVNIDEAETYDTVFLSC